MDIPLDIQFKGWKDKGEIEKLILEKAAKLERIHSHITSCHVLVEQIQHEQHSGHSYHIRIAINIPPNHEIIIKRDPEKGKVGTDYLSKILRDAFDAASRKVKKISDRQHQKVKAHSKEAKLDNSEEIIADLNLSS